MDRDITRGISSLYFGAACAVCFIGLTALFTSTNRAAPAVTVAVLALAPLRKSARSALAGLFLAACAGTAVLLWTPLGNRFREISGEYSAQMRRAIWAGNLTAWEKHPIFGIGRQLNHEQVMRDEVPKEFTRTLNDFEMSYSAHSLYIDALSGSGVVGFAATMGFWIVIPATLVWGRRRELRARTSASAVVWAFAMAYLAWFLGALTESSLDVSHNRMALCVLYGGLVGGLLIFEEDASSYDPRGRSGYEKRRQSV
jgi:O-antigen ligase